MRCKNSIELIGFVGQDPDLRRSPSGRSLATLSVGVTNGDRGRALWFRCVAVGQFAESVVAKFAKKGARVGVKGSLRSRVQKGTASAQPGGAGSIEILVRDLVVLESEPAQPIARSGAVGNDASCWAETL